MKTKIKKSLKKNLGKILLIGIPAMIGIAANINLLMLDYPAMADVNVPRKEQAQHTFKVGQFDSVEDHIRYLARKYNFQWEDYLVRLADCESTLNPFALGDNGNSRGLFQIHKGYHPAVSDQCAYDVECATIWAMYMINNGKQGLWTCDKIAKLN
jgi:hypothetical protein